MICYIESILHVELLHLVAKSSLRIRESFSCVMKRRNLAVNPKSSGVTSFVSVSSFIVLNNSILLFAAAAVPSRQNQRTTYWIHGDL
jgi:hypothetical protein